MKSIELANMKLSNDFIVLEFLYKAEHISNMAKVFMIDEKNNHYECCFSKCKNRVTYTYNNENVEIAKVTITLELKPYGKLEIKILEDNASESLKILNNKNEIVALHLYNMY